ncbi:hypothetical protein QO239_05695 [Cupriavidus taiwanensis]|uniref:hypothetical protein n=1 Tax=Cupriavidus taiwanensis TaxID=164546 RepID=UPI00254210EB|nr:hypothetical protein [Cupriavidus taiwanensis]MDK3022099.1 hypothetical protein [Cupriavidus taiwanensis]
MFTWEYEFSRIRRRSLDEARAHINLEGQKQWGVKEVGAAPGVLLQGRSVFAQNDRYLELCNPGWEQQGMVMAGVVSAFFSALIIWFWYGVSVHPLLFNKFIFFFVTREYTGRGDQLMIWFGWTLFLLLAIGSAFLIYLLFVRAGVRTAFFSPIRGRIRFNRATRMVYVLRPHYCGGNAAFEWDRLVALLKPYPARIERVADRRGFPLALFHPPFKHDDPLAEGEDVIFVGPTSLAGAPEYVAGRWEYIRRFMEEGPSVDYISDDAPPTYSRIPRYLPPDYSTYCGMPSYRQCLREMGAVFYLPLYRWLVQSTCTWPSFPDEWRSNSGLGEPEFKPVQTGAVMTALVYRAEGKLSKEDSAELMRHWGTADGLEEVLAR